MRGWLRCWRFCCWPTSDRFNSISGLSFLPAVLYAFADGPDVPLRNESLLFGPSGRFVRKPAIAVGECVKALSLTQCHIQFVTASYPNVNANACTPSSRN